MTLNTFLAFFTTFTKAAFIYPVVQCISQWKWNWFATNDERPLADFHTFDNASRGIIGSIGLLRLLKYRHIAAVGAIISLTSIATTPITQLLIEYPSRLVQVTPGSPDFPGATTRAVEHYQSRVGLIGSWSLDVSNYVSSGLVHPTDSLIPELSPSCSSGTCTWEPIESLALCSKVTNITDNLVIQQVPFSTADDWTAWDSYIDEDSLRLNGTLAYNISFSGLDNNTDSNEYFIAPVSYTVYSSSTSASTKSFPDGTALSRARVAGYKVIWADAGNVTYTSGNTARSDPWRWQAFEMIYYVCVNTYSVRVDNGTAKTELLSSTYDVVAHDDDDDESTGVKINCTAPKVVSGGAQFTDCVQDGRNPNLGLLTLRGSLNNSTGEHKNYTADIRSLTLLAKYITQDSTGIWAWDGMDHMVLAGNSGLPTLAHAVYGYVSADDQGGTDRVGNSSGSALLSDGNGDAGLQSQRLHNLANNVAVSITNGYVFIPTTLIPHPRMDACTTVAVLTQIYLLSDSAPSRLTDPHPTRFPSSALSSPLRRISTSGGAGWPF
ncbi:hypothetical protein QBC37DRAFT_271690 [Rhypophila decipiens]|uniref:Uncharacterized protein n=1 Tax=Rhypophila decipiens TaxID=261697 RepID=A0AAN7BBS4_9PEZI|nr:hypothetical protein QBC37DRAFT_271690 [Rhypophila decipiens]